MRIYLDASPVIYTVEQVPLLGPIVDARLQQPGTIIVVSELTRLDCRVRPIRAADQSLVQDFDQFFVQVVEETVGLERQVMERATEIRASFGFRTPDAIHLAASLHSACDVFLTNDAHLADFTGISVELVQR